LERAERSAARARPAGATAQDAGKDDWLRGKLFTPEVILKNQSRLKLSEQQRQSIGQELKRVHAQVAESDWQIMSEGLAVQELIDQHPVDGKRVALLRSGT